MTSEMVVQRISDDAWNVELVLGQGPGVWLLPVEVVFVGVDREHRETIRIEDETTRVEYTLPFRPERLEIDPLNRLFLRP